MNRCFWTVVLKTLKTLLDCKEIKPANPEGNQSWIFIGTIDAEAEALILWSPDAKSWLIGKDPDAGQYWRQEEKGTTEDKMVGWHHWLNGHEFEQTLGDGEGQGSLACCRSQDWKESDMTEWLNKTASKSLQKWWGLGESDEVLAWPFPDHLRNFTGLELIKFSDPDSCNWNSQKTNIQKQNTNVLFYSK